MSSEGASDAPAKQPNFIIEYGSKSQILQHLQQVIDAIHDVKPGNIARRIATYAPEALSQARSVTCQVAYALVTPVETTDGTKTTATALGHAGLLWVVFCRSNWIAKLSTDLSKLTTEISTEWRALSNRPVRYLCFLGLTAQYLKLPSVCDDSRYYADKANQIFKSINEAVRK